jgi:outer membrane protein assembly factor BamB
VILLDGSTLYSLESATGVEEWSVFTGQFASGLPVVPVLDGPMAYVTASSALFAFDTESRTTKWTQFIAVSGWPAIDEGRLYVVRTNGTAEARDAATGALVVSYAGSSGLIGPPIVTDDALIVSSATTTWVYARDTGALLQTVPDGGAISVGENHLLLAEPGGLVHAYTW